MAVNMHTFVGRCEQCGPAIFSYEAGKDDDQDLVWCNICGKEEAFISAEHRGYDADVYCANEPINFSTRKLAFLRMLS
jgi:hypothetical protein